MFIEKSVKRSPHYNCRERVTLSSKEHRTNIEGRSTVHRVKNKGDLKNKLCDLCSSSSAKRKSRTRRSKELIIYTQSVNQ
jgi:hypothetical protein